MKNKLKIFQLFLVCIFLINPAFSFEINFHFPKIKKKKEEQPKIKMVETVEEWEEKAQSVPLEKRELEPPYQPKVSDKKIYYPPAHFVFEKYNYPQGKREVNLDTIKKSTITMPYLVCDSNYEYVAYSQFYYDTLVNQISSNLYIEKLDTSKPPVERMLSYNHHQKQRRPIIESGTKEIYEWLYNGLTVVDWSYDSKKVLIKEKVGSLNDGIFKTYTYIHFLETEDSEAYTIKLDNFDTAIRNYFLDYEGLQLIKYKYDIEPIGFSVNDDDVIVAFCYVFDKNNNKIFLGTWGYNSVTDETVLFSRNDTNIKVSANGLILKQVIE